MVKDIAYIHEQFSEQLTDFVCKKVGHLDYCNDILQEVYIKIIQNIDKITKADNIEGYLIRICNNAVIDYHRAKPARIEWADPESDAFGEEQEPKRERALQLADCCLRPFIESLEPIYREALVLTDLEGMSQKQLAEKLGISLSGAKSRVQRAREKLKGAILQCCQYEFDKYGNIVSCCENKSGQCQPIDSNKAVSNKK